jgi:hypothetical protein
MPGAAPPLGCGAGVGSGTFSAKADPVANAPHSIANSIAMARIAAPRPAMSLSRLHAPRQPIRYPPDMANSRLHPVVKSESPNLNT